MEQEIQLNGHNKQEYPPMHTAEHILNQTMIRMFGCERSKNTHIERKKSKCDYILSVEPTAEMITEIENRVNEVIGQDLPVTTCFVTMFNMMLCFKGRESGQMRTERTPDIFIFRAGD